MFHVVLFSGGLDSVTLAYHTLYTKCKEGDTLMLHSFDTYEYISQAQHSDSVREIIADICMKGAEEKVNVSYTRNYCNVREYNGSENAYVAYRNTLFIFNALHTYQGVENVKIYLGAIDNQVEGFGDCTPEFVDAINKLIKVQGEKAELLAPFVHLTKYDILLIANSFNIPVEKTWSCIHPKITLNGFAPCRDCIKCKEREDLGIKI